MFIHLSYLGAFLRAQRERKHFEMLQLMRKLSNGFRDLRHFNAAMFLHTQRGVREEQKQLSSGKRSLIGRLKAVVAELKNWCRSPGTVPLLDIPGFDFMSLNFDILLPLQHCPWDQLGPDTSSTSSPSISSRAEQLLQKLLRCEEEHILLQREAKDALEFFRHQIDAGSVAIQQLQVLQLSLFDVSGTTTTSELLQSLSKFTETEQVLLSQQSRTQLTQYCLGLQHLIERHVCQVHSRLLERAKDLWKPMVTGDNSLSQIGVASIPIEELHYIDNVSSESLSLWSSRRASDSSVGVWSTISDLEDIVGDDI